MSIHIYILFLAICCCFKSASCSTGVPLLLQHTERNRRVSLCAIVENLGVHRIRISKSLYHNKKSQDLSISIGFMYIARLWLKRHLLFIYSYIEEFINNRSRLKTTRPSLYFRLMTYLFVDISLSLSLGASI